MPKTWQVLEPAADQLVENFPVANKIIRQLLYHRGLTEPRAINDFLNPDYEKQIIDPFLFADMEKAVKRILAAAKNNEPVMIYGDYDADGVCATAVLYNALKKLGINVGVWIPFREKEGYGLNPAAVQEIIANGYKLVITVDCGIANKEEVALFKSQGVEVIITDHHQEPLELPNSALAIINPSLKNSTYPFRYLCGTGVAFKIVQALMKKQNEFKLSSKIPAGFDKWLLDLVAIATVGDMVSLLGENRVLVKYGLIVLNKTRRAGVMKIIEQVNHYSGEIDAQYISWRLVPRINAAGRVNHASSAFRLIVSEDVEESAKLIGQLEKENTERQSITAAILREAERQVEAIKNEKLLWAVGENWQPGIVGLVAGKISDKYNLPAIVVAKDGDKYVGSGRSIDIFDITGALKQSDKYLEKYGGHPQACGFTVLGQDNFNKFKEKLSAIAQAELSGLDLKPVLSIEAAISLADIDWNFYNWLKRFEPYGEANPQPLFLVKNLRIEQLQMVGSDGQHLRAMVSQANHPVSHKIIGFYFSQWCTKLDIGDQLDVVFEIGINEWNNNRELQLKVVDLKKSEI
ncbi:MAG: single-stranded-DNA-specific exonuclease RecJ [Candidatus Buchananbacteria bacterium RIFCSPHIGHO2_02_FULL_40_13]|uniref:Single-stranded-DNA-specific exonuclease RecJ n=1 Tax=Candidatus Buchananbacteria bacterium RIFCSPLOWO2_01_FULL_39_33 TaxID=1797543 RepID=A0A1G1YL96_9BACT|nr:MAG: single-stranded-DNA-specific exonuclease RecJ [Candidatus Buchananbacteria bacterium RIFCSPHIGHO2_01_FULL_40_35]OGY50130.1 MAG: single-stranded-DNA-specific exonuclease RecJ [Candidatus Buchananbacteria bacterium RIFCSPHIGHO2_02_FULL_40_13]OGY53112.1 MAG: single-stranded-DNA-specific exonuclease RecJ [Candidatus Buchananbacteria bacterium RIFCSPLOWO2_01_FULL_39_33]